MGKSTAATTLQRLRVPLFDADRVVHRLLGPGGAAVAAVAATFPGVRAGNGGIDRSLLGQRVFGDREALSRLERIIHPMVEAEEKRFRAHARARREPIVVLDIPLLFESRSERRCDYVLVVSAPRLVQQQRVLRRPGMTERPIGGDLAQSDSGSRKMLARRLRRSDRFEPSPELAPAAGNRQTPACQRIAGNSPETEHLPRTAPEG